MTLSELSKKTGKTPQFLMNLQSQYELTKTKAFSAGYAVLLGKLVGLILCSVAQKDIKLLLAREKKLLELLKADSLYGTETWFEDLCVKGSGPTRLLLSGFDLGHPVNADVIQTALDFSTREGELFSSREMGADALRALKLYVEIYTSVFDRMRSERRVLASSLMWVRQVCR